MENANINNESEKKIKKSKIFTDKRGNKYVAVAFRCPIDLYEILDSDAEKQAEPTTRTIIRQLKRAYNFK